MKKKLSTTALAVVLAASLPATSFAATLGDYPDAPQSDDWSYPAMTYAVQHDLLRGIDGNLAGNGNLTRAQMGTVVNRAFGAADKADIAQFSDVAATDWFAEDMAKAYYMGTLSGRAADQMAPNASITREEVMAIMVRLLALPTGDTTALESFDDGTAVADWAAPSVAALVEKGIVAGADNKLRPQATITRAEFAALLSKTFPNIVKTAADFADLKDGNVLVVGDVAAIEDVHVKGSLIIADALANDDVTLKNVTVDGDLIVRGGLAKRDGVTVKGDTVLFGFANVDQRQYPVVDPFVHPTFYDANVKVVLNADGTIKSVSDNATAIRGLDPAGKAATWAKKNKTFWETALASGILDKFVGKTVDEVKAMHVDKDQADVVSGATESGKAIREAVINAIEGKAGKAFLSADQTLAATPLEVAKGSTEINFKNTLPEDFNVALHSVYQGIYNGKDGAKVEGAALAKGDNGYTLTVPGDLKAGHYFVNITDANGLFRSPDFESGHGTPRHYPHFVVKSDATLAFEDGKLTVSDGDLANVIANIEEIVLVEDGVNDAEEIEIEPIGHHGIEGGYSAGPFFNEDGSVNPNAKTGKSSKPVAVFEPGKTYNVALHVWGYGEEPLKFQVTAPENAGEQASDEKEATDEKQPDNVKLIEAAVEYGYDAKLKVTVDNGTIKAIEDNGTDAGKSADFWKKFVDGKGFDKFIGKDLAALKEMNVDEKGADIVSGATATSKAVHAALLDALK